MVQHSGLDEKQARTPPTPTLRRGYAAVIEHIDGFVAEHRG
jgi:hypothetical protein